MNTKTSADLIHGGYVHKTHKHAELISKNYELNENLGLLRNFEYKLSMYVIVSLPTQGMKRSQ